MPRVYGSRGLAKRLRSVAGLLASLALVGVMGARAVAQQPAAAGRVFGSDAGMVLNFIKADKAADFEAIVSKLKDALQKSEKSQRKAQAAGWKVFRAVEPGANGSVLFLFVLDPAVKGADYTVSTILNEAFPAEVQDLYKRYSEAYASGQNIVNLNVVTRLGSDAP